MYYRRKVVLALLEALGGELTRTDLQKHMLLFTQTQKEPAYDFVPYQYGCYSFSLEADHAPMIRSGLLSAGEAWRKTTRTSYTGALHAEDRDRLCRHREKYGSLRGNELIRTVYLAHPYYATRSKIASDLLDDREQAVVEASRPPKGEPALLTVGYEGRSFEAYLNTILREGVTVLCDVRKNPISRKYGFSKRILKASVEKVGIRYVHIPELGIASGKRQALTSPEAYSTLFDEYERETLPERENELKRIEELVQNGERVALTCFEACPSDCHRSRVSDALAKLPQWNAPVYHV